MFCGAVVNFSGGKVGLERKVFKAGIAEKSHMQKGWGEYALQRNLL
jgi:hypothetical protein